MDFTFNGIGQIAVFGCAKIVIVKHHPIAFSLGSTVYIRAKAQKEGKLEPVCLKRVNRNFPSSPTCAGIQPVYNYVDTLNGVWLEEELVWQAEAIDLATAYWTEEQAKAEALIASGCTDTSVIPPCR